MNIHRPRQDNAETEEHLPSRRTFLLRFSSATQPQTGICRGRIEHIPSGRTTRFTCQENIDDFVNKILTEESGQDSGTHFDTND